jgi:hypothetical protein
LQDGSEDVDKKMFILGPKIAVLRTNLVGGEMKVLRNHPMSLPQLDWGWEVDG